MGSLTLLIGGARSGKSDLAVQIGERHERSLDPASPTVTFIATAQRFDDDMDNRINRHRAERPPWPTIEEPLALDAALALTPDDSLAIIDCLTLWVSNAMLAEWPDTDTEMAAARFARLAADRGGPTVVVTNEVGLGIHPETDLGRRYRDLLGRVNRSWAAAADRTLLLVAGRILPLHDPWEFLP
ncbi:MAG: bifunctional adenosylcobinamide kinase/adenosylcobinamide-phosphate guanylyltransferase [Ilumatobacteraceae bacterium]